MTTDPAMSNRETMQVALPAPYGSPIDEAARRDDLRAAIERIAVHRGGRRLISPSGGLQSWLIDLRPVLLQREMLERIADAFWARLADRWPFQVGGMETAAIPLLTAILLRAPADRRSVTGFNIRKERKTTGLGNAIEGPVTDAPIVVVDDILNGGSSAEKARVCLDQIGRRIDEMFVVIDYRSRKGLDWRADYDIPVRSMFTLADFGIGRRPEPIKPAQRYRQLWHCVVAGGFPFYAVPKSTPLLADGLLYRGSDSGWMHAFDAATGEIVWGYEATGVTTRKGIWSSPALHAGQLYFGAYNDVVHCLDAATGREIWTQSYCEWVGASPLVVPRHGLLYIGLEYERPRAQGGMAALDLETGLKRWEHPVERFQHGSAAYWQGGDLVIWGSADHETVASDPSSGRVSWRFATGRSVKSVPAIDEARGLVAFASFDKSIYVLDAATGAPRAQVQTGEICYTTPLFVANRLFCGSGDRHLYVLDLDEMAVIKKIDLGSRVYASPRLVGGRVIIGTNGGRVVELDPISLDLRGGVQLPDAVTNAVAATDDGRQVFVSTYMNELYAYERLATNA